MCQDFQEQELLMELKMCNSTTAQQVAVSYVEVVLASPTFVVCMQMSAFGVSVCFRAMGMLQDINQSQNRRSRFSKMAMITLLNFNLPVKYGLMGHLASTDKITDGFYDVGKVCE